VAGVKGDLVLECVVKRSPAIAWEIGGTKGVAMEVGLQVGIADACTVGSRAPVTRATASVNKTWDTWLAFTGAVETKAIVLE
jgi:hypothetical protein